MALETALGCKLVGSISWRVATACQVTTLRILKYIGFGSTACQVTTLSILKYLGFRYMSISALRTVNIRLKE